VESSSGERRQEMIWNEGEIVKSSLNLHHPQTDIIYHPAPQNCTFKISEIRSHLMLTDKFYCTYMEHGLFSSLCKHMNINKEQV